MKQSKINKIKDLISDWYQQNRRDLPWRTSRDPYRIWISEVMLQQTTIQAVIPFYERFMNRFPNVKALATAPESEVLKHWAGLGYYSRARNIHKAAKQLNGIEFPDTYKELIKLPGFGDYTARAVTSIAFSEPVGVVDGNVIRLLSRVAGTGFEWWKTSDKKSLQELSDQLVSGYDANEINQAMMDIGSVLCRPQNPACVICPLRKQCSALKNNQIDQLPIKRAKKAKEIWHWKIYLSVQRKKIALTQESYTPFLKGQWLPPGSAQIKKEPPKNFSFRHSITHHDIYVETCNQPPQKTRSHKKQEVRWFPIDQVSEVNPSSIFKKIFKHQGIQ